MAIAEKVYVFDRKLNPIYSEKAVYPSHSKVGFKEQLAIRHGEWQLPGWAWVIHLHLSTRVRVWLTKVEKLSDILATPTNHLYKDGHMTILDFFYFFFLCGPHLWLLQFQLKLVANLLFKYQTHGGGQLAAKTGQTSDWYYHFLCSMSFLWKVGQSWNFIGRILDKWIK